jgi:predicted RNA polymerase sigma factor
VHALVALMALHASRLPARVEGGRAIPLDRQDRARWDGVLIREGLEHLAEAATGQATTYHLEAGIAACHAVARRAEDTDWARILAWYDRLVALDPSPVVAVQRAIAVGRVRGAAAGLAALDALADARLVRWAVFHAARGDLLRDLGRADEARDAWESAVALAPTEPERRTLRERLA